MPEQIVNYSRRSVVRQYALRTMVVVGWTMGIIGVSAYMLRNASRSVEEVSAIALLKELEEPPPIAFVEYRNGAKYGPVPLNVKLVKSIIRSSDSAVPERGLFFERSTGLLGVQLGLNVPVYSDSYTATTTVDYVFGPGRGKVYECKLKKNWRGWKVESIDNTKIY